MLLSFNTNTMAMRARQDARANQASMDDIQTRLNTGKKIASAKDNGALYSMAKNQSGDIAVTNRVIQALDKGISTVDVALAASETISDLLVQMKEKALAASDGSLDSSSRTSLNEDFKALRDQISSVISNASFNGTNLLNGSLSGGLVVLANENAGTITIAAENLTLGGSILTFASTATLGTSNLASTVATQLDTSINNLAQSFARLGTGEKGLERHKTLLSTIVNALEGGVSALVDADMGKESARLQAEQVRVQLSTQNLSFANRQPQNILTLFGKG
jgi:flagellin